MAIAALKKIVMSHLIDQHRVLSDSESGRTAAVLDDVFRRMDTDGDGP